MMNKRNTEGYVLAYLLIVITVMGLIAATLMASTVQVMSAQQNSIRYMQDKYEAMGEIEKLVAELEDTFRKTNSTEGIAVFSSSGFTKNEFAFSAAETRISSLIPSSIDNSLTTSDDSSKFIYNFKYSASSGPVSVTSQYNMYLDISIFDLTPEPEEIEEGVFTDPDPNFAYKIIIKSLDPVSYEITSTGGVS